MHTLRRASATREPAVAQAAAAPVSAPRDAIFLAESGVITFAWTMEVRGSDVQRGEAKLVFDHWGHRQATSGYPGPTGNKILIVDQAGITTYIPSLHYAVTTRWSGLETFSAEERRTLQDMLPPTKLSQGKLKSVAGLQCLETLREQHLPTKDVSTHAGCTARGIELESHDVISGGMMGGSKMDMTRTK
jgi:hypothetical protein